jgi:hypothetical protein
MLSAAGEAAGFGDCAEVAKLVEFHGLVLRKNWPASEGGPYKYVTDPIKLKFDTAMSRANPYRLCLSIVSELDIGTIGRTGSRIVVLRKFVHEREVRANEFGKAQRD